MIDSNHLIIMQYMINMVDINNLIISMIRQYSKYDTY